MTGLVCIPTPWFSLIVTMLVLLVCLVAWVGFVMGAEDEAAKNKRLLKHMTEGDDSSGRNSPRR